MKKFTAWQAAAWTHGTCSEKLPAECSFAGVSTDSREDLEGLLFIALKGPNFDGHRYARQALEKGAAAVLLNRDTAEQFASLPAIFVEDTERALRDLADGYRGQSGAFFFGVTGSVGKTTTKEMLAHLLGKDTARTKGNWNNQLGLPKSLLTMETTDRAGVFETGTNHPGEIAPLAALLRPQAAVVTAIAPAHIENFGTLDAIAEEKANLLRALPEDGFAVFDADGAYADYLRAQTKARGISVSAKGTVEADYFCTETDALTGSFSVHEKDTGAVYPVQTGMPGEHQILNALLALAAARTYGIAAETIAARFPTVPRAPMRWEVTQRDGVVYINDAYNANPGSMLKALETFAKLPVQGARIAVLGDMLELGAIEESQHRMVGFSAVQSGLQKLICVGPRARWIAEQARHCGMGADCIWKCETAKEAAPLLQKLIKPGDAVLLKASRGIALERVLGISTHP